VELAAREYEITTSRAGTVLTVKLPRQVAPGDTIRLVPAPTEQSTLGLLKQFVEERYFAVSGATVVFAEFWKAWLAWLKLLPDPPQDARKKGVVIVAVQALGFVYGKGAGNKMYIGNLSRTQDLPLAPYKSVGGKLVR
jgi:hypothetical protein